MATKSRCALVSFMSVYVEVRFLFLGEVFVLPRRGFAGFGDGNEDEGEFGGGDFDFDAGVVMPVAFGFVEFEDAVVADDHKIRGVGAGEAGGKVELEGLGHAVVDFSVGFEAEEMGVVFLL